LSALCGTCSLNWTCNSIQTTLCLLCAITADSRLRSSPRTRPLSFLASGPRSELSIPLRSFLAGIGLKMAKRHIRKTTGGFCTFCTPKDLLRTRVARPSALELVVGIGRGITLMTYHLRRRLCSIRNTRSLEGHDLPLLRHRYIHVLSGRRVFLGFKGVHFCGALLIFS
jgi:hypothetical protein